MVVDHKEKTKASKLIIVARKRNNMFHSLNHICSVSLSLLPGKWVVTPNYVLDSVRNTRVCYKKKKQAAIN